MAFEYWMSAVDSHKCIVVAQMADRSRPRLIRKDTVALR
jgi:hypothetical protein